MSARSKPSLTLSFKEAFLSSIECTFLEKDSMSNRLKELVNPLQRTRSDMRVFNSSVIPGFSERCKESKLRARLNEIPRILKQS